MLSRSTHQTVAAVMILGGLMSEASALTNYDAQASGLVTITGWRDSSMNLIPGGAAAKPAELVVTTSSTVNFDSDFSVDTATATRSGSTDVSDPLVTGQSIQATATGQIDRPPITSEAFSEFGATTQIIINNTAMMDDFFVDIDLDWQYAVEAITDSPSFEFGVAIMSIELWTYAGLAFERLAISDTRLNNGLLDDSGIEPIGVPIPAGVMEEITLIVNVEGFAAATAAPEPVTGTLALVGLIALGAEVTRRRRPLSS